MTVQFVHYYIASLAHTSKHSPHITWWAPNWRGYRQVLPSAGLYGHTDAVKLNDGEVGLAVPIHHAAALCVDPSPVHYDTAGPVVLNTRENWEKLIAASLVEGRKHKPHPMWQGRATPMSERSRMCRACSECFPATHTIKCPCCGEPSPRLLPE